MEAISVLLAAIKERHRNFAIQVLDHCFEQVLRGIEENDFKDAQRRVSLMNFLGSCYNYKVVHTDTLFTLLYKLINLDMTTGEADKRLIDSDKPSDCFRIRLVCTLLNSLFKNIFLKHKRRLLMDRFLIFFQKYVFNKDYLLMDQEIELLDTIESMRPKQSPKVNSLRQA